MSATVIHGDCLAMLRADALGYDYRLGYAPPAIPDESVHAVVTDPPYGLSNTDPAHVVETLTRWAAGERDYVPTGKGFMGKSWDAFVPPPAVWDECLRVLKPGGHLLAFAGSRTFDLMTLSIRFAGFDIRDSIAWLYGSGFPKSLDVSKAIDKRPGVTQHTEFAADLRAAMAAKGYTNTFDVAEAVIGRRTGAVANWQKYQFPAAQWWPALRDLLDMDEAKWGAVIAEAERVKTGTRTTGIGTGSGHVSVVRDGDRTLRDEPTTADARAWQGWGTALKPAFEPVVAARKPLAGTVAANVLTHGTGALNIDATRVEAHDDQLAAKYASVQNAGARANSVYGTDARDRAGAAPHAGGRWPTNVVLDGHAADALDEQTGNLSVNGPATYRRDKDDADRTASSYAIERGAGDVRPGYGDTGGASRFFPTFRECETTWASGSVTSASGADTTSAPGTSTTTTGTQSSRPSASSAPVTTTDWPFRYQAKAPTRERPSYEREDGTRVAHPTVKPVELMRWLMRLVTPPGGTVLDPFAGSGATVEAALAEGFDVTAIEREADYLPLIRQRIARVDVTPAVEPEPDLMDLLKEAS